MTGHYPKIISSPVIFISIWNDKAKHPIIIRPGLSWSNPSSTMKTYWVIKWMVIYPCNGYCYLSFKQLRHGACFSKVMYEVRHEPITVQFSQPLTSELNWQGRDSKDKRGELPRIACPPSRARVIGALFCLSRILEINSSPLKCDTKIWYQTSYLRSNFHHKKITKLTFRALALRRYFPIKLRADTSSVSPSSSLSD